MRKDAVLVAVLALAVLAGAARGQTEAEIAADLAERGQAPLDYVLARAAAHRITLIGEAHWLKQDAELVVTLVPRLQGAAVDLALEIFPASEQDRIDRLLRAPEWSEREATAVLRAADWPYREYRDILRAAWSANRGAERPIAVLALGPARDWRESLLPRGLTYDSFMADLVAKHIGASGRPIVVYCGLHHAFTRYYQAELDLKGRAMAYMDRMGNILSRRFGEKVFLIALHKPIWCGDPEKPTYCLPFGGRLDCAAAKAGRPVGFDVAGSPLAGLGFEPGDYYGLGHPGLRFVDYTDGYVWTGPLESFRQVTIIPLAEYAPDPAALARVAKANPFTDDRDVTPAKLAEIWAREIEENGDILGKRGWKHLSAWRSRCK
jgi:hypothetical protein